ncbi:protein windpipe [Uranotaenia lowii]|uniref:protein windpipe n=1 Tax=Uranotaenia lowii TaxID=190385 RepID=UPI00247A76C4|nr:protein windpipe [Uranotaenia lowii]XP_055602755.1 protein windpipe [Uranotaenia lowii]XP_055602756.1 protein windpipe [Uranotaenia lowii]XP_055602757.1 protein windpipe [Uranotaenia lowii]XP_055602758.1 protein windpipe [Uranotaenia lowii]XP_055602759.1 protein windpipe [Uranotaenia lowii]
MTSSGVTSSSSGWRLRWSNVAWVLLLVALVDYSSATVSFGCPRGCECNELNISCSTIAGLRGIEKNQPIQRLVLSGLELTKIPAQLENIKNITELDLSNNHLSEVNHLSKRVRKLNLSQNRITSGKLSKIPLYVEVLNLTHNDITYLPLHLMKLKKLRHIELANNPINCTCETLHIRNWLTTRHVWSDEHIKCSAPFEFKGRPWLQVKQSDVCHKIDGRSGGGYNWDDYEDENELMLGDQADLGDEEAEDDDDFKKEYFPVGEKVKRNEPPIEVQNDEAVDEGSGNGSSPDIGEEEKAEAEKVANLTEDLSSDGKSETDAAVRVSQMQNAVEKEEEDDEGSGGSGGGILVFSDPKVVHEDPNEVATEDGFVEESDEKPITAPDGLGIFGRGLDDTTTASSTHGTEDSGPFSGRVQLGNTHGTESPVAGGEAHPIDPTRADSDSRNTYVLLAILGIILVVLIVVVICKRKPDSRNRRGKNDIEGRGREMQDMDKNLLGKPIEKNGHNPPERVPLMNDRNNSDFAKVFADKPNNYPPAKPERTSLEKPSMDTFKPIPADRNKSKESLYENIPQDNNNTVPLQNGNGSLRNGDPAGVHHPNHQVPSQNDDVFLPPNGNPANLLPEPIDSPKPKRYSPIYVPTSPKSDRYSPVYSPETGRVKIKLTETPKPKTPILVTRSRSRAGDYITTTTDQKF